ncbi:hypothetical protein R3Q06_28850 [Rhodococcus erythropolis]|uniref:hypothetical protein n=1 Tax=Rhodococcus erythropolis TaxID=1833 RepID=UPI00294A3F7A|nr:hypothetical protein [Rhodococcus erythropolis]MDV6277510.1 hypothetical protein [Rhodococcus erythropolis]
MPAIPLTDQLCNVRIRLGRARAAGDQAAVDRLGEQQFRIEQEHAWENAAVANRGHSEPGGRTSVTPSHD